MSESKSYIDLESLQEQIENVIHRYRQEYSYLGGAGMTDRDEYNLTKRLTHAIEHKLEKMDTEYVDYLEERNQELEERLRMAEDPQFEELHSEYEGMRALVKQLIYMLGKEDEVIHIPNNQIQYKAEKVEMTVQTGETSTKVELHEMD